MSSLLKKQQSNLSFVFNILIVTLLFFYFKNSNLNILIVKNMIHPKLFLTVSCFVLANISTTALMNYILLSRVNRKISLIDSLLLQFVNNFLNKLFPKLGAGYRAYFLKKKYDLSYSKFTSTIAGLYIINFFTFSLIGVLISVLIYEQQRLFNWIMFLGFLVTLLFSLGLILFNPKIKKQNNRFLAFIKKVVRGWSLIRKDKRIIFYLVLLTLISILWAGLQLKIVYTAMNLNIDFIRTIYLGSIGLFNSIANITPDGLGVNEVIYGFNYQILTVNADLLVLGFVTLRIIRLIISFFFGGISYLWLSKELKGFNETK